MVTRLCRNNKTIKGEQGQYAGYLVLPACMFLWLFAYGTAFAAPQTTKYNFPAQPLAKVLRDFAQKSRISLIFSDSDVTDVISQKLKGYYSTEEALEILLDKTQLTYKTIKGKTYYIVPTPPSTFSPSDNNIILEKDPPKNFKIEEVIVTALRRRTSLQKTPISISILNDEKLARMGAYDILDYAGFVTGLTVVDTGPGQRRLVIRGVQGIGEAQVGLYYGDVPVTGTPGPNSNAGMRQPEILLYDTDRIEVLRGPQGTLYGTGSMGGTVRVLFNEPEIDILEQAFDTNISHTHYGQINYKLNGRINLPILKDKLAIRAVGYYHSDGGYIDNIRLGQNDINGVDNWGGRLQVKFQQDEDFSLLLTGILQRMDLKNLNHWYPGEENFQNTDYVHTSFQDHTNILNLKMIRNFTTQTLEFSSSFYNRDIINRWDTTKLFKYLDREFACKNINYGMPCNPDQLIQTNNNINALLPLLVYQPQNMENWSSEIRYHNNDDSLLLWSIGAFYEHRKSNLTSQIFHVEGAANKEILSNIQLHRTSTEYLTQIAFFGEMTYRLSNSFSLTLGSRYFNYTKEIHGETLIGIPMLNIIPRTEETLKSKEGKWINKIHAAYSLNEDILFYAQASQGYRIGGTNQVIGLPQYLAPFSADELWNYEIGTKTSWLDKHFIFNGSLYWIDWNNMQVTGNTQDGTFEFISNAGAARIKGAEVELTYYPLKNLLISAGLNYNDARLSEDQVNSTLRAQGRAGDRVPFVPKFTGSLYSQYSWQINSNLKSTIMATLQYIGQMDSDFDTSSPFNEKMGDYTIINLRYDLEFNNWGIYLFADNIFDKIALTRRRSSEFWNKQSFSLAPRTIGIGIQSVF